MRPWTGNAVLTTYKVHQRLSGFRSGEPISYPANTIDRPASSPREIFFRILLFKLFNKIETWELLEQSFSPITFEDYRFARYDELLAQAMCDGRRIYSAAYIMPPGSRALAGPPSIRSSVVARKNDGRLAHEQLAQTRTMQEGFAKLRAYPTIGDFLAYRSSPTSTTARSPISANGFLCRPRRPRRAAQMLCRRWA
jgi:hypothetical protein